MKLHIITILAACPMLCGAMQPQTPMPDLIHYRTWKVVNEKRYFVPDRVAVLCAAPVAATRNPSPHRDKYISVYVNPIGQKEILARHVTTYPVGTVVVKDKFIGRTGGTTELSTVMIKRERGYNPTGGDWEYAVLNGKSTLVERGRIARCQSCHAARRNQDFVFRTYRPGAPANPWKEGSLLP
jgi:hypothetical protein